MIITNAPRLPADTSTAFLVTIELLDENRQPVVGYVIATAQSINGRLQFLANGQNAYSEVLSEWSADLVPNTWIEPAGTVYRITEVRGRALAALHIIEVPEADGPYTVLETLVESPGSMGSQLLEHLGSDLDAHDASAVSVVPGGGVESENVQSALLELSATDAAESAARTSADAAEATARSAADTAESTARAAADTTLAADLAAEVGARAAAITAEAAARSSADTTEAAARAAADSAEATARAAADSAETTARLAHEADSTGVHGIADTSLLATAAAVAAEAATRAAADTAESAARIAHAAQTTNVHGVADTAGLATSASVTAEAAARSAADTTEATARAAADSAEAATRAAADTTLTNNLAAEVTNRVAAVAAEASARAAADTAEATTRANADTAEASARAAHEADTTAVHGIADTAVLATFSTRLDQFAVPTGPLNLNGQRLTNGALPSADTDLITKGYADALRAGLLLKADPVRVMVATNANINAPGGTLDSIAMSVGDRVLLTGQTSAIDNGIYVWNGAAVPMTRAADANTDAEMRSGTAVWVTAGTYDDQRWTLTTADPITLGVTAQTWAFDGGLAHITAGAGLAKTGNTLSIGAGTGIAIGADTVGIAAGGVGTTELAAGAVVDAKVGAGAAIAQSKIAGLVTALSDLVAADVDLLADLDAETAARTLADTLRLANVQTIDYTLVLSDAGKAIELNSATGKSLFVPPFSSVPFPNGTIIEVAQTGLGTVTLVAGTGVTFEGGTTTPGRSSSLLLRKVGTNNWRVLEIGRQGTYANTPTPGTAATAVVTTGAQTVGGKKTFTTTPEVKVDALSSVAPEIHLRALNSKWGLGIDVANNGGARDFVAVFRVNSDDTVNDIVYVANNDPGQPTVGIGVTPPTQLARLQVSGQDDEPTMGGLRIRVPPTSTAAPFAIHNSVPEDVFTIDPVGTVTGKNTTYGVAVALRGDVVNDRPLSLVDHAASTAFDLGFIAGGSLLLRNINAVGPAPAAGNVCLFNPDGSTNWYRTMNVEGPLAHYGSTAGFFGIGPVTRPADTAEIKSALASMGLLTDGAASPLNLDGGLLTAGSISVGLNPSLLRIGDWSPDPSYKEIRNVSGGAATGYALITNGATTIVNGGTNVFFRINGGTDVISMGAGTLSFYGGGLVAKQTGVAVTAAAIHAALVTLGLIGA